MSANAPERTFGLTMKMPVADPKRTLPARCRGWPPESLIHIKLTVSPPKPSSKAFQAGSCGWEKTRISAKLQMIGRETQPPSLSRYAGLAAPAR
jgi:hypothetical protein